MSSGAWLSPVEALTRLKSAQHHDLIQSKDSDASLVRYGYRIADYRFLVGNNIRSEVLFEQTIYPLPLSDHFVSGVVNLRGNIVVVFDLNLLLTNKSSSSCNVLILGESAGEIGVLVDEIPRAVYISDTEAHLPAIPDFLDGYVKEGISQDELDWLEFDCHSFFGAYASRQLDLKNQAS